MEITPLKRLIGAGIGAGMLLAALVIGNHFVLSQSLEIGRNDAAEKYQRPAAHVHVQDRQTFHGLRHGFEPVRTFTPAAQAAEGH